MFSSPKFLLSLFFIVTVLFSACSRVHTPTNHIPVSMNIVGPIDARNEITILNSQTKRLNLVARNEGFKLYADLQQWTDFIVNQLETELKGRGVQINPNSDIVLKVSVQNINFFWGALARRCIVKVLVERPDIAWSNIYEGSYAGVSGQNDIDGAVYRAIEAMLGDRGFQKALSRAYQEKIEEETVSEEDIVKKLEQLKDMKDRGLITEEEYQNKKKEILEKF